MRFYLTCTFLCALFSIKAQDHALPLNRLLNLEYRIFSVENPETQLDLLFEKALVYRGANSYQKALNTLDRMLLFSLGDSITYHVTNERILLNYLLGNHQEVKSIILQASLQEGGVLSRDSRLVEVLNYILLGDFQTAQDSFMELFPNQESLQDAFRKKHLINPDKAFNLSLLFPGSGQIYAGYFVKGVISVVIQATFMTLGIKGLINGFYFTEALPSIAIFQGFYFGGAEHAAELSNKKNNEIKDTMILRVLESTRNKKRPTSE